MSLALYMDENVPQPITTELRWRGVDVLTAKEDGRAGTPDPILLDRATALGRVMFSQDNDLPEEAERRYAEGVNFSGVIFADQEDVTINVCISDLEIIAKASNPEDLANQVLYLPFVTSM